MEHSGSPHVGQQSHIGSFDNPATRDIPICEIRDGARNNSNTAMSDEVKAQDAESLNTNIVHTLTDQLSQCERHKLQALSSLNSQQTQARICAQRALPAHKAGGPRAKRQGAKAVKKMEQHSTEYKLSSENATTSRALSARANYLSQDRAEFCFSTKDLCRQVAVPNRHLHEEVEKRHPQV